MAAESVRRQCDTFTYVTRRSAGVRLDSLLRTACDVIAERGLANTRAADVAKAAGVSQALVFYHFATKEQLLEQAFSYAVEEHLNRVDSALTAATPALPKLRRLLNLYTSPQSSRSWTVWLDCWAESARVPELEQVSRRLDLRWRDGLARVITEGVDDGSFTCDDPGAAAWRIYTTMTGVAVQVAAHDRLLPRRRGAEWIRLVAARELGVSESELA